MSTELGKLIVIEGSDASGKETQAKSLVERLNQDGYESKYYDYPNYKSPTGLIVGFPYLGKSDIVDEFISVPAEKIKEELADFLTDQYVELVVDRFIKELKTNLTHEWFPEGASNVDPKVASLFYAIDRYYNRNEIENTLLDGYNVVCDRYVYSNMGHQGGKLLTAVERIRLYNWIKQLEFGLLGLREPDAKIFLHMPTDYAQILKRLRKQVTDEHEQSYKHLKDAEMAFVEVAKLNDFKKIECIYDSTQEEASVYNIRNQEEISEEVYEEVKKLIFK